MNINYPNANDKFDAASYKSLAKEVVRGEAMEWVPLFQDHPSDSAYGTTLIGAYNKTETAQGYQSVMSPITYATAYNTGSTHQFLSSITEIKANEQELTDDGAGTVWSTPYKNLVYCTGSKQLEIYVDGVLKTLTTDYAVDYPNGKITFLASQAGSTVTWNGYYLDNAIGYMKASTDSIKIYDEDATYLTALPVLNMRFDHWTSSTQPGKWTKAGTVGRTAAYFKSFTSGTAYDATLTATVGWSGLSQTLSLTSSIDQCVAIAVAKTTYSMRLRVSVDGGVSWNSVSLTPSSQGVSKWHFLAVQSAVNTTSAPQIEFNPQVASGDTSIATLAYIGLINGGLM